MSFVNSLIQGTNGEQLVLSLFHSHDIVAEIINEKYYDIAFTLGEDDWRHVEVKNDIMAEKTGNLAIEIYNPKSNIKSGLSLTKAEIWATVLDSGIYFVATKQLKTFTKKEKPVKDISCGGDDNAKLLLYKKDHILPIFCKVDNLDKDAFICLLRKLAIIPI